MKKILIISTGGTFNKVYHPENGELLVDDNALALKKIASKWLCNIEYITIIGKDSLDMTSQDRLELLATINQSNYNTIIVIHGTDTMSLTAEYLADAELDKCIVLTGAMVPYAIDSVEASANFASAVGYAQLLNDKGVYIAMNGCFGSYEEVKKDYKQGKFIIS